jgi:hypothetical protein
MKKNILFAFFFVLFGIGCTSQTKLLLKIESTPPDALVSVFNSEKLSAEGSRKVAGSTPVEKELAFYGNNNFWLQFEKRGYVEQIVKVTPETKTLSVRLERAKDKEGRDAKEFSFPFLRRVLMARPDVPVIQRGFSKEQVSAEETNNAAAGLQKGVREFFAEKYEVMTPALTEDDEQLLRTVWRDARTAMEVVDPIRLKYLPENPSLENKGSREAARQLGVRHGAEALLLIAGKQNIETAGLKIAKIGVHTAGTAASYGSGYANAMARGDSYFVYTIYTPQFAEGTLLKAVLIDCSSGEIFWANRGLWAALSLADAETVKMLSSDLFAGL